MTNVKSSKFKYSGKRITNYLIRAWSWEKLSTSKTKLGCCNLFNLEWN